MIPVPGRAEASCIMAVAVLLFWAAHSGEGHANGSPSEQPRMDYAGKGFGVNKGWKDPFSLPPGIRRKPEGGSEEGQADAEDAAPQMKVTLILTQDSKRVAVVDGHIVKEGDWIDEEQVSHIGADRVVLRRGGEFREIVLEQSSVPLSVLTTGVGD